MPNAIVPSFFDAAMLAALDATHIPRHIAIIPDGNRRWAKKHDLSLKAGHQKGSDVIMDIVKASKELGVEIVTFYTFSTENWTRPKGEIRTIMWLLESYLKKQQQAMIDNGIRLETIGDLYRLPKSTLRTIENTKAATAQCTDIQLVLAINYGGRDEICRAFQRLLDDYTNNDLQQKKITEKIITQYLDTKEWPDPDLFIRTSGETRVSNFLLWQISYTELYVTDLLWPDFTPHHLLQALLEYQQRERRLGA